MKSLGSQLPSTLLHQAKRLRQLNQHLLLILPLELHGHVQIAAFHHSLLVLEAESPVWATKARYFSREIANHLSEKTGLSVKSVKFTIQPTASTQSRTSRKKPYISKNSAHQLESLAKSTEDPRLKQSLAKLAKRGRE